MHIAVEGCSHGSLDEIYATVRKAEEQKGRKVDLLLLCGDFQALRNRHDFAHLAVPDKYKSLGSFHAYYAETRRAEVFTVVIGGNHESSGYMWELYHGGFLAPNIYYLGAAGSIIVNGIRIAGASGIYKSFDYTQGHYERIPYDGKTVRSCYHIREYDVFRLSQLTPRPALREGQAPPPDIFMSHDWPVTITRHGDERALLRRKAFFADEVRTNTLGSPPLLMLLNKLAPSYWFAAHLHVKFAALVRHGAAKGPAVVQDAAGASAAPVEPVANPDEIDLDDEDADEPAEAPPAANADEIDLADSDEDEPMEDPVAPAPEESVDVVQAMREDGQHALDAAHEIIGVSAEEAGRAEEIAREIEPVEDGTTRFLALDKCGPGKDFIQFLDIPTPYDDSPPRVEFDPEWLAITRAFHPYLSLERRQGPMPTGAIAEQLLADAREWVQANIVGKEVEVPVSAVPVVEGQEASEMPPAEGLEQPAAEEPVQTRRVSLLDINATQHFVRTAPTVQEGGGGPAAWYTNPQTEAFCALLQIPNLINPPPPV